MGLEMVGYLLSAVYSLLAVNQAVLSPHLAAKDQDGVGYCSSTRIQWESKQYLLTAGHCCAGDVSIEAGGVAVAILDYDTESDLCLLSAPPLEAPAGIVLAKVDVQVGEPVVGYGRTRNTGFQIFHCAAGPADPSKGPGGRDLRLSRCPGMPGYSGGGILDLSGDLVGVTSVRYGMLNNLGFVSLKAIHTFLLNAAH